MKFPQPYVQLLAASAAGLFATTKGDSAPVGSIADAPWQDLMTELSSFDALIMPTIPDDWVDQCVSPFQEEGFPPGILKKTSNWALIEQPSGLCTQFLSCAYEKCEFPYDITDFDPDNVMPEKMNLANIVLRPKHVGDLVAALKFATKHKIPVSVKTGGNSFAGASSQPGTLLVHMVTYTKYVEPGVGGITECESVDGGETDADVMACRLAEARNKKAIIRTGGGQVWSYPLRAIYDWNKDEANKNNRYQILSGSSGTVSSCGGWLASTGMGMGSGQRYYGMGVDQVLHMEMVLPGGTHVRFGPSLWQTDGDYIYPKTTEVKGFCNSNPQDDNEENWNWQDCDEDINFEELWFAVRGGGGGTYGIVVSVYYQLHSPNPRTFINPNPSTPVVLPELQDDGASTAVYRMIHSFMLDHLFFPEKLGVSEEDSAACFVDNAKVTCYSASGAEAFLSAWELRVKESEATLTQAGLSAEDISDLKNSTKTWPSASPELEEQMFLGANFFNDTETTQYQEFSNAEIGVPSGQMRDRPGVATDIQWGEMDFGSMYFLSKDALMENFDDVVSHLAQTWKSVPWFSAYLYAHGGNIAKATDQMVALPEGRRQATIIFGDIPPEQSMLDMWTEMNYRDSNPDTDKFPGGYACHNHFKYEAMGPLKDDWTKACDAFLWDEETRVERCMSLQEAVWGTDMLDKLEGIHSKIDPNKLFSCFGGVGYKSAADASTAARSTTLNVLSWRGIYTLLITSSWLALVSAF